MANVCRANKDKAGGTILVGSSTVTIDGFPVALEGDVIQKHGNNEHEDAKVVGGTSKFIVDGKRVCISGISKGTCGHVAVSDSSVSIG